jgi:hypothetical protein
MPLDLHKRSAGKAKARNVRIQTLDVRSEMLHCRLLCWVLLVSSLIAEPRIQVGEATRGIQ